MGTSRFELQRYTGRSSRYTCPACEKPHEFTRYLDTQTGELVGLRVGKCNREAHCNYHYTPKQYFADNPSNPFDSYTCPVRTPKPLQPRRTADSLPWDVVERSLAHYDRNSFVCGLVGLLTEEVALTLARRYFIGTTHNGSAVFWQVDERQTVRSGKIMTYDAATLKRLKHGPDGLEVQPTWAHSKLRGKNFRLQQCLFGQHLLAASPSKAVAIVESEKTAVLCSVYLPDYTWLATGGCAASQLKYADVLAALQTHQVLLFPDTGTTTKWQTLAKELRRAGLRVRVSEELDTPELARPPNWDLADEFLAFAQPVSLATGTVKWALTEPDGYPIFWDYPSIFLQ